MNLDCKIKIFTLLFVSMFSINLWAQTYGGAAPIDHDYENPNNKPYSDPHKIDEHRHPDYRELDPRNKKPLEKTKTSSIKIECNVSNAEVFLNGVYQGRTDIVIDNLRPGRYRLDVSKPEYETAIYYINVRADEFLSYYVTLQELCGTLVLENIPGDAEVYIDSSRKSFRTDSYSSSFHPISVRFDVRVGTHTLTVKKFGYNDFSTTINVMPYDYVYLNVEMSETSFSVYNFSASPKKYNPEYSGTIGQTEFSFFVTANGELSLSIYNADEEEVFSHKFMNFSTWKNYFLWNGKNSKGEKLPDGIYSAVLSWDEKNLKTSVEIDSSLSYPVLNFTPGGLGYGSLPCAIYNSTTSSFFAFSGSPIFDLQSEQSFFGGQVNLSFSGILNKFMEINIGFSGYPGLFDTFPVSLSFALKISGAQKISDSGYFCYGGNIRYGFLTREIYFPGVDAGVGLGGGILFGFDFSKIYAGLSSQVLFGSSTGNLREKENLLESGITISLKPIRIFFINLWTSYNYSFGTDNLGSINLGGGINFLPGSSNMLLSFSIDSNFGVYKIDYKYLKGTIGISFIF